MSYPKFGTQLLVGHRVARFEGAAPLSERFAVALTQPLRRLGGVQERPDERVPLPGQELKIALGGLEFARRKGVHQAVQSLLGLGFHGGSSVNGCHRCTPRNLRVTRVSVQFGGAGRVGNPRSRLDVDGLCPGIAVPVADRRAAAASASTGNSGARGPCAARLQPEVAVNAFAFALTQPLHGRNRTIGGEFPGDPSGDHLLPKLGPRDMAWFAFSVIMRPHTGARRMSTEAFTGIGTGIAIIVVNVALFAWLRSDIHAVRDRVTKLDERMTKLETELRERMAKLEGLLDGLRESISGRRAA